MGNIERLIECLKSIICDIENENYKIYHVFELKLDLMEAMKEYITCLEKEVKNYENI